MQCFFALPADNRLALCKQISVGVFSPCALAFIIQRSKKYIYLYSSISEKQVLTRFHSISQCPRQKLFPLSLSKGKLEALAILLQKLKSDGRRVLIFTQMVKMLDILEAFLDHRKLSYVRVDESFTPEERQVRSSLERFSRAVPSSHSQFQ